METSTKSSGFEVTQLTAINIAKIVTILCLISLALIYGVNDYRDKVLRTSASREGFHHLIEVMNQFQPFFLSR